jgi:hypothetical protein
MGWLINAENPEGFHDCFVEQPINAKHGSSSSSQNNDHAMRARWLAGWLHC